MTHSVEPTNEWLNIEEPAYFKYKRFYSGPGLSRIWIVIRRKWDFMLEMLSFYKLCYKEQNSVCDFKIACLTYPFVYYMY